MRQCRGFTPMAVLLQPYIARYSCLQLYRQRANAENRITELKYDFGADSFNLKDFNAI